jgi:hypothetical protein
VSFQFIMLYCSIMLHCIDLTSCFTVMPSMSNFGYYSLTFFFIDTTSFALTGHHHMYRLLWLRHLLLTVKLFCFSYMVAWTISDRVGYPPVLILVPLSYACLQCHLPVAQRYNPEKEICILNYLMALSNVSL